VAIVVLPRIEQENPFGQLAEVISEQALPYLVKLYANKDKIAKLSDTELTDFVEVLQRHAPELVENGKINWDKVNEWAQSDDPTKLKVASFLFDAKRVREDFANAPLIAKLDTIDIAGSVNPQELNKIFVSGKMQQKLSEAIGKSNLPDAYKLLFLANIEKFAEKPELIPILEKVLSEAGTSSETTKTEATESGNRTGGWRFSLDGSKSFGIKLEEPQLTSPQVSPPHIPKMNKKPIQTKKQPSNQSKAITNQDKNSPPNQGNNQQPNQGGSKQLSNSSEEISLPSEVPFYGDIKKLFTNEELLGAGAGVLSAILALAATKNPQFSVKTPLLLASLKETGKKAGAGVVSAVKQIPTKIKQAADKLAQTGIISQVEPPLPKQDEIARVINPPKPPSVSDLLKKQQEKPAKGKGKKGRKSKK
jgi:hypothetical protein